jgi:hypothetical protein
MAKRGAMRQMRRHQGRKKMPLKQEELFFSLGLGFELRAYILSHSTSPFLWGFFKIESLELFGRADFEP